MEETYKIHIVCSNCYYKTTHIKEMVEIKKGTSVDS